ncbi:ribosomal RNA small subunit methyltransferase A [Candidatus Kaiserbacteria bacterium]|nr:ribosomal RNA small subunit methyltransferase A [Candidatus Kaiserbacteria bacterium]
MSKKRAATLGQHFLNARWAATLVAQSAGVAPGVTVLEIGPGTGNLTHELLALGGKVIAVEKDSALIELLRLRFRDEIASGALTVIGNDIRNVSPETLGLAAHEYVLSANIPYYITGDIIRTFLETNIQPKQMALLVQKEVAERIARSKKESILSLSVKAYGTPKYVKTVSRSCFSPAPNVDSAILAITNISRDFFSDISEEQFFKVLKAGFASKRKMLAGNLKKITPPAQIEKAFQACGIKLKIRAEDVSLKAWGCLVREL